MTVMRKFFFCLAIVLSHHVYSQQFLARINPEGPLKSVRGMLVGQDVLLVLDEGGNSMGPSSWGYLIGPDGKQTGFDTQVFRDKALIAGVPQNDSTVFYFVDVQRKKPLLKYWTMSNATGKGTLSSGQLEIPGKIYGSYVEGGDLFLLCSIKRELTLKLLCIRGARLVSNMDFPLSFDLGKQKESNVSFFKADDASLSQLMSPIKILKDDRNVWIISDESPKLYFYDEKRPSTFRSTVIRLDLTSGKSTVRSYYETSMDEFATTVSGGFVYRATFTSPGIRLQQFNFETNQMVFNGKPASTPRDVRYHRYGPKKLVSTSDNISYTAKLDSWGAFIKVDSASMGEKILTCGNYAQGADMPILAPIPLVGLVGLAATLSSLVIRDLSEGYGIANYYYYAENDNLSGFRSIDSTSLTQQVVDNYEMLMQGSKGYDYKGYIHHNNVIYWVYQRDKKSPIEIVKFGE